MAIAPLTTRSVTVDFPEEVVDLLGSREDVSALVRQALVLDLLRNGEVSQGRAARLLGSTRHDILDMMVRYCIPSGPQTVEELREDIENTGRFMRLKCSDGSDQHQ
jgi:predicted HTH domain antitoxin